MGVARYRAAQELLALDPSLTLDDCASMTMRELRDRIAALEAGDDNGGTAADDGNGGGAGCRNGHEQGQGHHRQQPTR